MSKIKPLCSAFKISAAAAAAPLAAPASAMAAAGLVAGPVTFASPWVLAGLASLPVLWWMMKTVPPQPKTESFPAMQILFNLKSEGQEPMKMPWWQRSLRMLAASLVVLGLAQPQWHDDVVASDKEGPTVLVVDNGWASAPHWSARETAMKAQLDKAAIDGRSVVVLATAVAADGGKIQVQGPMNSVDAQHIIGGIKPHPWPVDRQAALESLKTLDLSENSASVVWLSNGLNATATESFTKGLQKIGDVTVLEDGKADTPYLLTLPDEKSAALSVSVKRVHADDRKTIMLTVNDDAGRPLGQTEAHFSRGAAHAEAVFDLPSELRNQAVRVSVDGVYSAGTTLLLDERWRRRPVGVLTVERKSTQVLLNETHYIQKALDPFVDLRRGKVEDLLKREIAVMVMTDSAQIDPTGREKIKDWVKDGGTLLRFAGSHLAENPDKEADLLPVHLRRGERVLGSALSGGKKGYLEPFEKDSPFYGIAVPSDLVIKREVLAQPGPDLEEKTWARLHDGTPLVTAAPQGKGWIVLVHTTAHTDWSNLPLSGMFVDMSRAIVAHSQGVSSAAGQLEKKLPPLKTVNELGQMMSPSSFVKPLSAAVVSAGTMGPASPPGFYGDESARVAYNLSDVVKEFAPLPALPKDFTKDVYKSAEKSNDLKGMMLSGAMAMAMVDMFILFAQQGHLSRSRKKKPVQAKPAPGLGA